MSIDHPRATGVVKIVFGAAVGTMCAMHSTACAIALLVTVAFFHPAVGLIALYSRYEANKVELKTLKAKAEAIKAELAVAKSNAEAINAKLEVEKSNAEALKAELADWDDAKVHVQRFLTPQMSEDEKAYIAQCIKKFPKIERAGVVSQADHLILPEMDVQERVVVFQLLTEMNAQQVEAFTAVMQRFMRELSLAGGELIDHQSVMIYHLSLLRPEQWASRMERLLPQLGEVLALIPHLHFESWLFSELRKPLPIVAAPAA